AVSKTSPIPAYRTTINSNNFLLIHNTADGTYLGNITSTDTHLSANNNTNSNLGHSGTTTLNIYTLSSTGTATLAVTSTETNPLNHPRGTITNNLIAAYQNILYIIDQTGTTIGTYTAGAQLNAVDISRLTGLWAVAGGTDTQAYFLTKSGSSGWFLQQTTQILASVTDGAISTTGYYALIAADTKLYLFSQSGETPSDTVYWLNGIVINANGSPYIGQITFGGDTITTDSTGKFMVLVTPGTTYTITAGTTTTQYTATNVQYQTVAIKIQPDPYATNVDYSATWNDPAQALERSYADKPGRTDPLTWKIRNTATNEIVYQQTSTPGTTITYPVPAEQQYTNYQISMSADRTNTAGSDTQISNTWLITPSGSSPIGLPLDDTGKNILFMGVLMLVAGLFGVLHSTKGAIAVAALAAFMRYMEIITIPWIVIIIALALAFLAALARASGGN
ncbi:MAG: hypothetical protein O0W93_08065, partial [Methanocorpusculum sp.]|nr:hypothetical protein [Methanocorpusculum sp.]